MLLALFLFANALLAVLAFYHFYYKRAKLPPGPVPLPLIGNLYSLQGAVSVEACFERWRRQFGDVYTFWLGEMPVVMVTDYAKIMQTFQRDGDAYAGRKNNDEWEKLVHGDIYGVVITEGELWREHRRFALHVLRDFGLGKNLMQERILAEVHSMVKRVDQEVEAGTEVDVGEWLDICIGSIISALLFGYRFDDERLNEFWEVKHLVKEMFENFYNPMVHFFRWKPQLFRRIPLLSRELDRCVGVERNYRAHFQRQIEAHLAEIDVQDWDTPPTDFVEAFLKEKARRDAAGEQHSYTIDQLKGVCSDLWVAGQETTSTTIAWGVAYLIHNQRVQARIHAELDAVVGNKATTITVADKQALPYTNAVICEIQRFCNLLPINVVHRLTRDVQIDGMHLKEGTAIMPQISVVLADEKIFDCPDEFRPERFLDAEGKLKRVDELIPFSVGKRQCLGESLARMELFLFVGNLLNKYKFLPGREMPSLQRKIGATIMCPKFTCRVEKRQ